MGLDLDFDESDVSEDRPAVAKPETRFWNTEQNERDWLELRAGVITGSMFHVACAVSTRGSNKGEPTAAAQNYAFRLAVERIAGKALPGGPDTWATRRGHEHENHARFEYEFENSVAVINGGFIVTTDNNYGCSPDGFVGNPWRRGLEIKAFTQAEKMRPIMIDRDVTEVRYQAQGGMWLTGLDRWDVNLYCDELIPSGMQLTTIPEYRDDKFIDQMVNDLKNFNRLVNRYKTMLTESRSK